LVSVEGLHEQFFSINDLCQRWSCGRTTAYKAVSEMERGGYLNRIYLFGGDQRIALRSVETWERLHAYPPAEDSRVQVVALRVANAPRRKRVNALPASESIVAAWKKVKASGG
jgi:hypothetical protein